MDFGEAAGDGDEEECGEMIGVGDPLLEELVGIKGCLRALPVASSSLSPPPDLAALSAGHQSTTSYRYP